MALVMQVEERTFWRRIDWNLVLIVLALNIIGLINLYSASHSARVVGLSDVFLQQVIWLVMGWFVYAALTFISYDVIKTLAFVIYIFNVGALILVRVYGTVSLGAQRWLDLGFFRYQPSETMKLAVVLLLARLLAHRSTQGKGLGLWELALPLFLVVIPFGLIVEQPDLGTALMVVAIAVSMFLFVRVRLKLLLVGFLAMGIALPVVWTVGLREYQRNRVLAFLTPDKDPQGTGYNSIQSRIAVGSGRILGKGFQKGSQSQLEFLPERHTDFIFSVLSEEHGFVGSVTTIGLFAVLFFLMIRIGSESRDRFGALLTVGVLAHIFWHMVVNIGMVLGLLPIVGVPLPLVSYGGSSLLTTMIGLGLVSSVAYRRYLF